MAILTFFLLIIIPYVVSSFSFNLTNFNLTSHSIILDGGASISSGQIHVTRKNVSENTSSLSGRATYVRPLHLWSSNTAETEVASFSTSFSFVIDSNNKTSYSDGLTFFLAEHNDVIGTGRELGLPISVPTVQFVAVEFDTYDGNDSVDDASVGEHVGINIQNLTSVTSKKWLTDIPNGRECEAWISYDSLSKNLSVSFTNFQNNSLVTRDSLFHIVDLRHELPEWVIFGFSAAIGGWSENHIITSWRFNSSDLLVDTNNFLRPTKGENKSRRHVVGLIVGLSVVVTFLGIVAFVLWKKKKKYQGEVEELRFAVEMSNEFEIGSTGPRRFSYLELARSTANFAENEKLGEGGFGAVYKGFLKDSRTYVAVKRVSETSKQGFKEYASEVRIISRVRHRNLVQLIGWCHQKGKLLLVYEFMENGSLDLHLFKGKSLLTWSVRYKIANGLASALQYLHFGCTQCVLHRDIKSSNVMLDSDFNAKLGDFGLAKLVDHEKGSKTTILAGTMGYMAPEYVATGKASKESDVFSFGVVALEIACGRKPIETTAPENQIGLVEWVWELYGMGSLLKAVDPRLGSDFEKEEMKRLMMVGLWCVHPDLDLRPSMKQVLQVLNSEASLPVLPSRMPVASYFPPTTVSPLVGGSNQKKSFTTSSSYIYGR